MNDQLSARLESLLARIEILLPASPLPDWNASVAFRWRRRSSGFGTQAYLQPVRSLSSIRLTDLKNIDEQKKSIDRNTRQFVNGLPANNEIGRAHV